MRELTDAAEQKKQLRRLISAERRALSPEYKAQADRDIFEQLLPLVQRASAVFTYCSTQWEADTRALIAHCFARGIPAALPICRAGRMTFRRVNSSTPLCTGSFGIQEPPENAPEAAADSNTLCVVPAMCADGSGMRLGYGGGYYDRFLRDFAGKSVIICYSRFKREVPAEPHDIPTDFTIFDRI